MSVFTRIGLALLFVLCVAAVGWAIVSVLPPDGPATIDLNDDMVGIRAGWSYAYLIRTHDHKALLIDAGSEPDGKEIKEQLTRWNLSSADVKAVLLTHGHWDHWAAAPLFNQAVVYVEAGDQKLVRGDKLPKAMLPRLTTRLRPRAAGGMHLHTVLPGALLRFGDISVEVISTPGHTPGSLMYLVGDVLFSGDSLQQHGDGVAPAPRLTSDNPRNNVRSLWRLKPLQFTILADGHTGVARDGRQRYQRWLAAQSH